MDTCKKSFFKCSPPNISKFLNAIKVKLKNTIKNCQNSIRNYLISNSRLMNLATISTVRAGGLTSRLYKIGRPDILKHTTDR